MLPGHRVPNIIMMKGNLVMQVALFVWIEILVVDKISVKRYGVSVDNCL